MRYSTLGVFWDDSQVVWLLTVKLKPESQGGATLFLLMHTLRGLKAMEDFG